MKKKTKIRICVFAGVLLIVGVLSVWSMSFRSFFYSETQHISRVRKRAEKRFLGAESEYTELEVYPIYNEKEKLTYMLVELKPQGFIYVKLEDSGIFTWLLDLIKGTDMYMMSASILDIPDGWTPYRVTEEGKEYFYDENGEKIVYFESPFNVAGIENERRYVLEGSIPAVKRGEQFLDLVDGALIDYKPGMDLTMIATDYLSFIPKPSFKL